MVDAVPRRELLEGCYEAVPARGAAPRLLRLRPRVWITEHVGEVDDVRGQSGDRGQHGLMNIDDAADLGIAEGDEVVVRSPFGRISVPVGITKDIVAGVIAVPHGWGHKGTGGWRVANQAGGANVNQLTSSDPADVEVLSGMAWLTGVPVRVEKV